MIVSFLNRFIESFDRCAGQVDMFVRPNVIPLVWANGRAFLPAQVRLGGTDWYLKALRQSVRTLCGISLRKRPVGFVSGIDGIAPQSLLASFFFPPGTTPHIRIYLEEKDIVWVSA